MTKKELLHYALKLPINQRFWVIENLLESLDQPDEKIDEIWAEEAEKRLDSYRRGKLEGIPFEEIFNE